MASKDDIIALERTFWQTMVDRDIDAAAAMMAGAAIVTGAQGAMTIDPKTFAKMMADGKWTLRSFKLDKLQVQFTNDDTAIIGYEVTESVEVNGEPLEMTAYDASVWTRADGDWKCALHTESVKGDAFGRDRVATAA